MLWQRSLLLLLCVASLAYGQRCALGPYMYAFQDPVTKASRYVSSQACTGGSAYNYYKFPPSSRLSSAAQPTTLNYQAASYCCYASNIQTSLLNVYADISLTVYVGQKYVTYATSCLDSAPPIDGVVPTGGSGRTCWQNFI